MTRETLVAEHGFRLYVAESGATACLQQRFTTSHGRDVWRDVPKVMGSGEPWVPPAGEVHAPYPKLGASFETVAQAYARDERASLGIAAAFLAGAEFGAMRAANEFMAATRTPPPTGIAILQDGTLNLAFVANGLRFYANHLEGKPQRGDYFPADLRLAAEMLVADTPPPETHVVASSAFSEWFNAGPEIAKTAGFAVEITAISAVGSTLKLTSADFDDRAALAATEGSTDA